MNEFEAFLYAVAALGGWERYRVKVWLRDWDYIGQTETMKLEGTLRTTRSRPLMKGWVNSCSEPEHFVIFTEDGESYEFSTDQVVKVKLNLERTRISDLPF